MKRKPYSQMTAAELAAATRQFDTDYAFDKAKPLSVEDRKRHAQARRRGRPRIGLGAEKVRVTIERGLLRKADSYARAQGISRSELIARGLREVLVASK